MPLVTIVAIVVILGVGSLLHVNTKPRVQPDARIAASPDVYGVVAHASPSPFVQSSPDVRIDVESNTGQTTTSEKLVYPGAVLVRTEGDKTIYETSVDGETVYEWYVSELENRSYTIRNKVKTRANDKLKAVVSGASNTDSLNVTIDQENTSSKTQITVE